MMHARSSSLTRRLAQVGLILGLAVTSQTVLLSPALAVDQPPTITSADNATFQAGAAGNFTVTTTAGTPSATTITRSGTLPSGVSFTDNGDGTATLAGTPGASSEGSYPFTIIASNGIAPDSAQAFTLTVTAALTFTSADNFFFAAGAPGSFTGASPDTRLRPFFSLVARYPAGRRSAARSAQTARWKCAATHPQTQAAPIGSPLPQATRV